MTRILLFPRRHGFLIGFHLDAMPFAGLFDFPLPFGFSLFAGGALGFGFAGDNGQVAFGFFRFAAAGKRNYQDCGRDGDEERVSHFCSPGNDYERVFPFARSTGRLKKEVVYGC